MRQYVLVSQGVEIFRTTDKAKAEEIMSKGNEEWYVYKQLYLDNCLDCADNEIFIYEEVM